jgi:hypothetical protein
MTVSAELLTEETVRSGEHAAAAAIVAQLEQALTDIGRHLAWTCASQGALDEALLDQHQIDC